MNLRPATKEEYPLGSPNDRLPEASRGAYQPIVNQAYFMGLFEFDGLGNYYYDLYLENLKAVTSEDIQKVIKKYLQTRDYVMMVVE